jgi:hypothetical protein
MDGTVGSDGVVSLHGIDPGSVKFELRSLDGKAWDGP